ncbi:putative uncharacterized protein [Rhodococcus sp. AW25M09]|uniref:aldo/keto reductase n=1 Tax=Rhodococcus sp. AW25M09 TaxID=1268303 RepID=UPI0002AB9E9D|nr:aldo/keto reductase [Rhodococcus sp. AW25M09]CCQ14148.1 putative uncharacterized protein [Rhodococcus sp. AW25M09]
MKDLDSSVSASARGFLAGRSVHRVGYGAMQLAERGNRPPVGTDEAVALLRRAVELGVDHIDTAEFYGDGVANEFIRTALHPYSDDLVLVSKVGAQRLPDGTLVPAQKPSELRAGVEANLRRLAVERVAVVNLRRVDGGPGIVATGDQIVDLDSQLAELISLRDEGKIGGIGLSNVDLGQLRHAMPAGIVCVQNVYNLLDRTHEVLLAECREHDVAFVPFFPLGSGFPGARRVTEDPAVVETADRMGTSPAQVGLAWLLAHAREILLIPGTADVAHLELNIATGDLVLDDAALRRLDSVSA